MAIGVVAVSLGLVLTFFLGVPVQHDSNHDSISTCLLYIYFYRYNYLCLGEHVLVF
jgi:hypothetical protein